MSVYRQASHECDTEKMKRALGYTGKCTEKAAKYQEKLDEGMKAEAKDEREKINLEQEAAIEKRREEHKRAEENANPDCPQETDLVQISEAAKAALKDSQLVEAAEPVSSEPVIYYADRRGFSRSGETESDTSFFA